jgi:hypothetical protein
MQLVVRKSQAASHRQHLRTEQQRIKQKQIDGCVVAAIMLATSLQQGSD